MNVAQKKNHEIMCNPARNTYFLILILSFFKGYYNSVSYQSLWKHFSVSFHRVLGLYDSDLKKLEVNELSAYWNAVIEKQIRFDLFY